MSDPRGPRARGRIYQRLDPGAFRRLGFQRHYTPAQFGAYIACLNEAEYQPERGRFRDMDLLKAALTRPYAAHLPFLIQDGQLRVEPDGSVLVDGWDDYQEGDMTGAERQARWRARHDGEALQRNGDRNASSNAPSNGARNGSQRYAPSLTDLDLEGDSYAGGKQAAPASLRPDPMAMSDAVKVAKRRYQAILDDPKASDGAKSTAQAFIERHPDSTED